jgi:hypothetical protein
MSEGPGAHRAAQYAIEQVERAKTAAVAKSGKLAPLAGRIRWTGTCRLMPWARVRPRAR